MDDEMTSEDQKIQSQMHSRYEHLAFAISQLEALKLNSPHLLAAVDMFVEKAQHKLTIRAVLYWLAGALLLSLALLCLGGGLLLVWQHDLNKDIQALMPLDGMKLTLLILRSTTLTAFILGAVYMLFSFAKAFFHEGAMSHNRRHALRFGRLYVYLKIGSNDPLAFDELERAFGWHGEGSALFKDIPAEPITGTLAGKLVEQPTNFFKSVLGRSQKND